MFLGPARKWLGPDAGILIRTWRRARDGLRTRDLGLDKAALSQLSYAPTSAEAVVVKGRARNVPNQSQSTGRMSADVQCCLRAGNPGCLSPGVRRTIWRPIEPFPYGRIQ